MSSRAPNTALARFLRSEIEQSIVDRFAEQASQHAQRTAVLTAYEQWSYADLDARTNAIAAAIVDRCGPVGKDDLAYVFSCGTPFGLTIRAISTQVEGRPS